MDVRRIITLFLIFGLLGCVPNQTSNSLQIEITRHSIEVPVTIKQNELIAYKTQLKDLQEINNLWQNIWNARQWEDYKKYYISNSISDNDLKLTYDNKYKYDKQGILTILYLLEVESKHVKLLYTLEAPYESNNGKYPFRVTSCYRYINNRLYIDKINQFNELGKFIMFTNISLLNDGKILLDKAKISEWAF